jgi:hypothetical protein
MIDAMPRDLALLCLGLMLLWGIGLIVVLHVLSRRNGKDKRE